MFYCKICSDWMDCWNDCENCDVWKEEHEKEGKIPFWRNKIMENKKVCPLKFTIGTFRDDPLCYQCEEEKCAWWCQWTESCAMVAIPAELDNQAANIMQIMSN